LYILLDRVLKDQIRFFSRNKAEFKDMRSRAWKGSKGIPKMYHRNS